MNQLRIYKTYKMTALVGIVLLFCFLCGGFSNAQAQVEKKLTGPVQNPVIPVSQGPLQ